MFPKHFSAGEGTYNNCLLGCAASAFPGWRVHASHGMLHTQYEFILHFHPEVLIKHRSTGKGSYPKVSPRRKVYREPGCQFIAHLLVHISGMATWYERWAQSRLVPSRNAPRGGWKGVGNVQHIYTSAEGFTSSPTSFSGSLLSPRIQSMPPLCKSLPWLTVQ